jgi:hypothetical protein
MDRRTNQIRVVDPEQDRRLRMVADALLRSGVPDTYALILAEGHVARLRRRVYSALDDVIGSGDDLEALAGWQGPPRSLSAAMQRAGYVREVNGVLIMVDAVAEAPEYVKKRWQRQRRASYDAAVKRAAAPNIVHQRYGVPGDDDDYDYEGEMSKETAWQQQGLFGPDPQGAEQHATTPGHREVRDYWLQRYAAVFGRDYVFGGRDAKAIATIIAAITDVHRVQRIIDAYFTERREFFAGHPTWKLAADINRYAALAGKPGRGPGGNAAMRTSGRAADAVL